MNCTKAQVVKEDIDGCKLDLLTSMGRSHELVPANSLVGLPTLPGDRMLF